jgi:hypothetical protein
MQSEVYTGPITLPEYERFQNVREMLRTQGIGLALPNGN